MVLQINGHLTVSLSISYLSVCQSPYWGAKFLLHRVHPGARYPPYKCSLCYFCVIFLPILEGSECCVICSTPRATCISWGEKRVSDGQVSILKLNNWHGKAAFGVCSAYALFGVHYVMAACSSRREHFLPSELVWQIITVPIEVKLSTEISILSHDFSAVSNYIHLKLEKHNVNLNGHFNCVCI